MAKDVAVVVGPASVDQVVDDVGTGLVARAHMFDLDVARIEVYRLVHMRFGDSVARPDEALVDLAEALLVDPVGEWWMPIDDHGADDGQLIVETGLRPGVTDREGAELVRAAAELGIELEAATVGRRHVITTGSSFGGDVDVSALSHRVLHNDVIERWSVGTLPAAFAEDRKSVV